MRRYRVHGLAIGSLALITLGAGCAKQADEQPAGSISSAVLQNDNSSFEEAQQYRMLNSSGVFGSEMSTLSNGQPIPCTLALVYSGTGPGANPSGIDCTFSNIWRCTGPGYDAKGQQISGSNFTYEKRDFVCKQEPYAGDQSNSAAQGNRHKCMQYTGTSIIWGPNNSDPTYTNDPTNRNRQCKSGSTYYNCPWGNFCPNPSNKNDKGSYVCAAQITTISHGCVSAAYGSSYTNPVTGVTETTTSAKYCLADEWTKKCGGTVACSTNTDCQTAVATYDVSRCVAGTVSDPAALWCDGTMTACTSDSNCAAGVKCKHPVIMYCHGTLNRCATSANCGGAACENASYCAGTYSQVACRNSSGLADDSLCASYSGDNRLGNTCTAHTSCTSCGASCGGPLLRKACGGPLLYKYPGCTTSYKCQCNPKTTCIDQRTYPNNPENWDCGCLEDGCGQTLPCGTGPARCAGGFMDGDGQGTGCDGGGPLNADGTPPYKCAISTHKCVCRNTPNTSICAQMGCGNHWDGCHWVNCGSCGGGSCGTPGGGGPLLIKTK